MPHRQRKPTSPGRRFQTVADFSEITKTVPERTLVEKKVSTGGRNNYGRKTARHRGGGHKQKYRIIDFRRNKDGVPATVAAVEYDPNRSCRILLLHYHDGEKRYILAPEGLTVGQSVMSGAKATPEVGNTMYLKDIPLGTIISSIEMTPGKGAAIARSAGSFAQLNAREGKYAIIKLPSGEIRNSSAPGASSGKRFPLGPVTLIWS